MYSTKLVKIFFDELDLKSPISISEILAELTFLKNLFLRFDPSLFNNYIHNKFLLWLNKYVLEKENNVLSMLGYEKDLMSFSLDFIDFCFSNNIKIDKEKTLKSFEFHNQLSDQAIKNELIKISKKNTINLLGFGLDDGSYEKEIAKFLIDKNLCKNVNVYGFDPHAKKGTNIFYLTPYQLLGKQNFKFDIIIARWSLHHVTSENRWNHLIQCINCCNPNALILFIEHGSSLKNSGYLEKIFYDLLNSSFDIIANIGLRPSYCAKTKSNNLSNFYIKYLCFDDYISITDKLSKYVFSQKLYNIGPFFPNQTIYKFLVK